MSLTSIQTLKVDALLNHTKATKLKKAVVQFIAMWSNREDIIEEEKLFKKLDKNGDGYITAKELKKGLKGRLSDQEIKSILNSVDQDQNGAISYTEFLAATLNTKVLKNEKKIRQAFRTFDADGDGKITSEELWKVLVGQDSYVDDSLFDEIVKEVDENGDGKIDYLEFARSLSLRSNG